MAMVTSEFGGTVVSRKNDAIGPGNGGFLLIVNTDGSITFRTESGDGFFEVVSDPTHVLDGDCHTIAGVRTGAVLSILFDGREIGGESSGNATPPLDVNNALPVTVGISQQLRRENKQFVGAAMNVSLWSAALSGDQFVRSAFARIEGREEHLQAYWMLDNTTNDESPNRNPLNIVGFVRFEYCLDCVWAQSGEIYTFCSISNMADSRIAPIDVRLSRDIFVAPNAPVLAMGILAIQDSPAFPAGAHVRLMDPTGKSYNASQNTELAFVATHAGQPWAVIVKQPLAGSWRVEVTAPSSTAFQLFVQTVPPSDVVETSRRALDPLYGEYQGSVSPRFTAVSGFWDSVVKVAVGVTVAAIVVAAIVETGGAGTVPALVFGLEVFSAITNAEAARGLGAIDTASINGATLNVAGMSGFIVALDRFLILDAYNSGDDATPLMHEQREKQLYPAVVASPFNKVRFELIAADATLQNVTRQLTASDHAYVTANAHGLADVLTGWNEAPDRPQDVLTTFAGPAQVTAAKAQGKIFHFFACECGRRGSTDRPGLGRRLVQLGALAFFGYEKVVKIDPNYAAEFAACDIEIDLALMSEATCEQAHQRALALYIETEAQLRGKGAFVAANALRHNYEALVSPVTSPVYGDKKARLRIE